MYCPSYCAERKPPLCDFLADNADGQPTFDLYGYVFRTVAKAIGIEMLEKLQIVMKTDLFRYTQQIPASGLTKGRNGNLTM
ncbi:unnamed protein product [Caenorhabditis brenneri]